MQRLDFHYDPICPFCWITSRWILQVADDRKLDITWRPLSLAILNNELDGSDTTEEGEPHRLGHRVHRVILAAAAQGHRVIDLYSAFGRPHHLDQRPYDDALIAEVLADLGLPADLAKAADDTSWDKHLQEENEAAAEAMGGDTGVPVIVLELPDGQRRGLNGPILCALPSRQEGVELWDALTGLAPIASFYGVSRVRPDGMPDTSTTSGL